MIVPLTEYNSTMMLKLCTRNIIIKYSRIIKVGKRKTATFISLVILLCVYLVIDLKFFSITQSTWAQADTTRSLQLYEIAVNRGHRKDKLLPSGSYQALSADGNLNQSRIVTVHHFLSHDHMYLIENKDRCSSHKELQFIIVIFSVPDNFTQRDSLRQKLLSQITLGMDVTFVFLLGQPKDLGSNYTAPMTHKEENDITRDIVQGNFVDSYKNLTLKSATMIHWVKNFCKNSKFVLKMDSDIKFDLPSLVKVLKPYGTPNKQYTLCNPARWGVPIRDQHSKYFVNQTTYIYKKYPCFCSGPAYFLTTNAVEDIWWATYFLEFFSLEDVYLTGLARSMLHMAIRSPRSVQKLFCSPRDLKNNITCSLLHVRTNVTIS